MKRTLLILALIFAPLAAFSQNGFFDSFEDGICCDFMQGGYTIFVDWEEAHTYMYLYIYIYIYKCCW